MRVTSGQIRHAKRWVPVYPVRVGLSLCSAAGESVSPSERRYPRRGFSKTRRTNYQNIALFLVETYDEHLILKEWGCHGVRSGMIISSERVFLAQGFPRGAP
jgi:hypothetical protein